MRIIQLGFWSVLALSSLACGGAATESSGNAEANLSQEDKLKAFNYTFNDARESDFIGAETSGYIHVRRLTPADASNPMATIEAYTRTPYLSCRAILDLETIRYSYFRGKYYARLDCSKNVFVDLWLNGDTTMVLNDVYMAPFDGDAAMEFNQRAGLPTSPIPGSPRDVDQRNAQNPER
jgi:hypothetical protein